MTNQAFIKRFCAEPYALERVLSILLEDYWKESSRRLGHETPPVVAPVPEIRKFLRAENTLDADMIERVIQKKKDEDAVYSDVTDVVDRVELEILENIRAIF